ncbi:hypothetical protein [Mycolicibacterium sp. XJ870]
MTVGRRRWALPRRFPSYPVHVPELPHGLQLTGIGFAPRLVPLEGILPDRRMTVPGA